MNSDLIYDFIDWSAPVGVAGYSMGGGATLDSAGNEEAIEAYNIAAGVALHPITSKIIQEGFPDWVVASPIIPTLFATSA